MGMVSRTITFTDIDGDEVTETWNFSLDESDAVDMELMHRPDVEEYMDSIVKNKDSINLVDVFKQILFASVGRKEGKLFVKDADTLRQFKYGGAYRQFFSEILEMDDAGAEFFNSIMPEATIAKAQERANRKYTNEELLAMSDEDFRKVAGKTEQDMSREMLLIAFQRKVSKAA